MGSSSDWDDSILSALGPLVGLLSSETIQSVDNVSILSYFFKQKCLHSL